MSEQGPVTITIDGPSGVGKSTISRRLATRLGFTYLDTGAMYRAVAWYINKNSVNPDDAAALQAALEAISIDLMPAASETDDVTVLLNGEDISDRIRSPEMSMLASKISALAAVRSRLTLMQQELGRRGDIVAEGRDTGTVVFPGAAFKFYLDASPEVRAERRASQLEARGEAVERQKLLEMTIARDRQDSERAIAPLKKADDALLIDTTELDVNQVLRAILGTIGV
jgi:cytidylate kinase